MRPYNSRPLDAGYVTNPSNDPNHNPKRKSLATVSRTSLSDEATTVCTTQSPLTRNTQTQSTISALEETIHRQQQEIQNMLTRFDAMDTKMEHLTTAIKSGELNQNNTIIQIQQQLDKVCTSLTFLVQQSTNKQPIQQTPQSHNDVHSWVEATDIPTDGKEKGAEDSRNNNVAAASSRSRSPEGKSPEKKKQRSSAKTERRLSLDGSLQPTAMHIQMMSDEETLIDTDQSGAQDNCPSPSDGARPD
jgi:hypothetical protein